MSRPGPATVVLTLATLLSPAPEARAQEGRRVWVGVAGGASLGTVDWRQTATWEEYREEAGLSAAHEAGTGPAFEAQLGYRLSRRLGLRAAFGWARRDTRAAVDAQIPHPFFFGRPRAVSGEASGLEYRERTAHLDLEWRPIAGRLELAVFAGPSLLRLETDVVERVTFDEQYPFDEASFGEATARRVVSRASLGWSVGVSVAHALGGRWGLGLRARYTRVSPELTARGVEDFAVDAGGLRTVAFLRLGF